MTGVWYNSLRFQILVLLSLALLPIGSVAVFQTNRVAEAAERNSALALLALTEQAAKAEQVIIEQAFGAARVFASVVPDFIENPERCTADLAQFVAREENYSFIGIVPKTGMMTCSSSGTSADFSSYPGFAEGVQDQQRSIVVDANAPISHRSVFVVSEPYRLNGEFGGFVSISIPHTGLPHTADDLSDLGLKELITFNLDGEILTARTDIDGALHELPIGRPLAELTQFRRDVYQGTNARGEQRTYTIVPIDGSPAYVLGVWNTHDGLASRLPILARPALFPTLMWISSMCVAMLAIYTLVLRHITRMRRRMDEFAENRTVPAEYATLVMPNELQALEDNFLRMTNDIVHDEAQLEDALRQKSVLIKEVHHRVKNNLQLISSIMNMQIRNAEHAETRQALSRLQDRVLSLSTIHRDLYQSQGDGKVNVGNLISEIVEKTIEIAAASADTVDVTTDIDPVMLFPDQAVPLSLMMSEAATNAMKYIGHPDEGGTPSVRVSLKQADDHVTLIVANSVGATGVGESTGLGAQLIRAFSIQLGATIEVDETPERYEITVKFQIQDFEPEARDF